MTQMDKTKVFIDGNENLLNVCWSVLLQMRNASRDASRIHISHPQKRITLCGISTLGLWEFDIWDKTEHESATEWGFEQIDCLRCRAVAQRLLHE